MELVVPDEKLSLAIGRKGQNVRLASQLTGWKLDIISESKFKQMEEEAIAALASIEKLDRNLALDHVQHGLPQPRRGRRGDRSRSSAASTGSAVRPTRPRSSAARPRRMEKLRQQRLEEASSGDEVLTERDELLLIPASPRASRTSCSTRATAACATSEPRTTSTGLAIRTGLGSKKAQELQEAVEAYLEQDSGRVDDGQRVAREKQAEVEAKARAEVQARVDSEAAARAAAAPPPPPPQAHSAQAKAGDEGG